VIHRVLAASSRPSFQRNKLLNKLRIVEQRNLPRIDGGQGLEVDFASVLIGLTITNSKVPKRFLYPLARVGVTINLFATVFAENLNVFGDNSGRTKWRPCFP
jgi:hypothetical protein